tara:strand:+ start:7513 stop:7836 length:324 start_codon:yes stop_codon:yes gene_type:complete
MDNSQEPIIIDLTDNSLNEYVYSQFSNKVNILLQGLYQAGLDIPLSIRGTQDQVDAFFNSLKGEKRYMDSYMKNGLNNSKTMIEKRSLEKAVSRFETETGLRWPFKN